MSKILKDALKLIEPPDNNINFQFNKNTTKLPYTYSLESNNKSLHYLGVKHTRDPDNYQINLIKSYILTTKPGVILLERFSRVLADRKEFSDKLGRMKNESDAVTSIGEMSLAAYIANKEGVHIESLESDKKAECDYLLMSGFSLEDIFVYHCCVCITSFLRLKDWQQLGENYLESYIIKSCNFSLEPTGLFSDFHFSLDNFKSISETIFKQKYNFQNLSIYKKAINLTPKDSSKWIPLNELCKTLVYYR